MPDSSKGSRSPSAAASQSGDGKLSFSVWARLSLMFFLQYAIWGSWLPLLWPFLADYRGFSPLQIGQIFAIGAVGAIFAPFIAGQIADRWFSTERFLGVSHLIGAALVWQLAKVGDFQTFLIYSFLYSVIYAPTLALTNSLAFHHLPNRDRYFGWVRVFGTVGWICAGLGIGQWLLWNHTPPGADDTARLQAQAAGMADAFRLSAILGAIMGVYCFFLPHTPPTRGRQAFATWEARSEVQRNPRLLALFLFSVAISCIHQFYFVHTASFLNTFQSETAAVINRIFGVGGAGLMTVGQMSEIVVLAVIPLISRQVSRKTLLAIGILAYFLRMAMFAYVNELSVKFGLPPVAILIPAVALHGFCFGCFIFVAFMVVDEETTPDVRASAQGLYNLVIVGFGIIVGSPIASAVAEWAKPPGSERINYQQLFAVPMWAALLCLLIFLFLYPPGRPQPVVPPADK